MSILTKEQKEYYLHADNDACLFCHSENIERSSFQSDGDSAWRPVECLDCGENWFDVYQLSGVETMDEYKLPIE
jgi:hypothetical protein